MGESIDKSQQAYDFTAIKQLSTGKGNLIRQAEILRQLGVKATGKIVKYIAEGDGKRKKRMRQTKRDKRYIVFTENKDDAPGSNLAR